MSEPSKRKRHRVDRDKPIALSAKLLASWRVRIPKYLWKALKANAELSLSQSVAIFNAINDQMPAGWRIVCIRKNGRILVMKPSIPSEPVIREL